MPGPETALVVAVLVIATVIRSAFGFGEALVAVPLLALVMPVQIAAPIAALTSVTVAGVVLLQDWSDVHVGSAGRLVLASVAGIPVGLVLLTRLPEAMVKGGLALVIIAFSLYALATHGKLELRSDRWAWLFGFCAGVLGGAYAMNGPPLAIYGALRRWSPQRFRATLQGYFFPASLMVMLGYLSAGLWTGAVTRAYLTALPFVLVAVVAGRAINRRLTGGHFLRYVHVGLVIAGSVLLAQVLSA
ncbi:MAG: sulfite exporter TauE/SafE family protein [Gemmatimonadota bacterium]|nr:sulfite exporter TauE/SafE family protein [Gemmatimonadota bacterium]